MKKLMFLILSLVLVSCGQDYNSNTFDKDRYGTILDVSSPEGLRFSAAYSVLEESCTSCHTGYHSIYASYITSQDWINSGLIVQGDWDSSLLRNKLKNYGGNMPASGSELSDSDLNSLQDWVDNL